VVWHRGRVLEPRQFGANVRRNFAFAGEVGEQFIETDQRAEPFVQILPPTGAKDVWVMANKVRVDPDICSPRPPLDRSVLTISGIRLT